MKTFDFHVENLGPIKTADFCSSHFNVLCGKNNCGKSICMHTIFCFFRLWRKHIHLKVDGAVVDKLVDGTTVEFDVGPYLQQINSEIARNMPGFVKNLPRFLKKSSEQFAGCKLAIKFDDDYLQNFYGNVKVSAYCKIGPNVSLRIKKSVKAPMFSAWIDNQGGADFPSREEVEDAANKLLDFVLVERVLPQPYLLTAERSGSILYGDGLRNERFFESQSVGNQSEVIDSSEDKRYSAVYNCELKEIWNAQGGAVPYDPTIAFNKKLLSAFQALVSLGTYDTKDGRFVYTDSKTGKTFDINESSTSVRALLQVNYFVKSFMSTSALLMIDEPELNLHPAKQRAFVRFLAKLVNVGGVGIVITTHSDCIVRELNTLLALGSDVHRFEEVMKRHGYSDDEVLASDNVACGIVENSTIETKRSVGGSGFAISSFDETFDKINSVQDDIMALWREEA